MSENPNDPREELRQELEAITIDGPMMNALAEFAYTAGEAGMIGIRWVNDQEGRLLAKLVLLAQKYKDGAPERLRM